LAMAGNAETSSKAAACQRTSSIFVTASGQARLLPQEFSSGTISSSIRPPSESFGGVALAQNGLATFLLRIPEGDSER
jgi:hypothetical protein